MTAHVRQRYELIQELPWKTIAASKCMEQVCGAENSS